jgi:anti-sigma factor RsiW
MGGGALTVALAQEAEPGDPLRKCWLAHERLRVPASARSINRAEILTARTDTTAEAAEAAAAEAAFAEDAAAAEAAAAVEAVSAVESAAAAGAPRKPPPMRLARKRLWRPSCRKSLAAARSAWPRALRKPLGGPCLVWGPERN